jgi:hypothetical protein
MKAKEKGPFMHAQSGPFLLLVFRKASAAKPGNLVEKDIPATVYKLVFFSWF